MPSVRVARITAEYATDRTTVATPRPRLSWATESAAPGWLQAGAEVELDGDRAVRLDGRDSVLVDWPFEPLGPGSSTRPRSSTEPGRCGCSSAWSSRCCGRWPSR